MSWRAAGFISDPTAGLKRRVRAASTGLVGSRTGAMLRRFGLSVAPRFLWECLTSRTVNWFPAPAASNPSCRFPAMGLPACFRSRVMRPTRLAGLSVMTRVDEAGSQGKDPASRTATSDSTVASRDPIAPGRASDVAESSSLPSLWRIDMLTDSTGDRAVQERRVTQAESS